MGPFEFKSLVTPTASPKLTEVNTDTYNITMEVCKLLVKCHSFMVAWHTMHPSADLTYIRTFYTLVIDYSDSQGIHYISQGSHRDVQFQLTLKVEKCNCVAVIDLLHKHQRTNLLCYFS